MKKPPSRLKQITMRIWCSIHTTYCQQPDMTPSPVQEFISRAQQEFTHWEVFKGNIENLVLKNISQTLQEYLSPPYNNILTIYKRMLDMTCWRNSEKRRGQDWQWIEIEVGDLNRPWKAWIILTGFRQRGSAVPEVSSVKVIWQDLFAIGKLTVVGG